MLTASITQKKQALFYYEHKISRSHICQGDSVTFKYP